MHGKPERFIYLSPALTSPDMTRLRQAYDKNDSITTRHLSTTVINKRMMLFIVMMQPTCRSKALKA
jgi:hypothetical protein